MRENLRARARSLESSREVKEWNSWAGVVNLRSKNLEIRKSPREDWSTENDPAFHGNIIRFRTARLFHRNDVRNEAYENMRGWFSSSIQNARKRGGLAGLPLTSLSRHLVGMQNPSKTQLREHTVYSTLPCNSYPNHSSGLPILPLKKETTTPQNQTHQLFQSLKQPSFARHTQIQGSSSITAKIRRQNELQIDCDSTAKLDSALARINHAIFTGFGIRSYNVRPSRSSSHWHISMYLDFNVTNMEAVALQAIIGSDWKREAKNFFRCRVNSPIPILFLVEEK
jgi:hypothetical protein